MNPSPDAAINALRSRGLISLPPLAIVLGSGLGAFADEARDPTAISYLDIPGFRSRASKAMPGDWSSV